MTSSFTIHDFDDLAGEIPTTAAVAQKWMNCFHRIRENGSTLHCPARAKATRRRTPVLSEKCRLCVSDATGGGNTHIRGCPVLPGVSKSLAKISLGVVRAGSEGNAQSQVKTWWPSGGKAVEGYRSPRRFAFAKAAGEVRQVLDCASPLGLGETRGMDNG